MLCHIVLFRPKPGLTPEQRRDLMHALDTALREIPAIRRARLGERVQHGRGYEGLMREDFSHAGILEFDDISGLREYLQHPAHERLGALLFEYADAVLIYDYAVEEREGK
jgi:hypothetical protein